jgi:hypothetical protein
LKFFHCNLNFQWKFYIFCSFNLGN